MWEREREPDTGKSRRGAATLLGLVGGVCVCVCVPSFGWWQRGGEQRNTTIAYYIYI